MPDSTAAKLRQELRQAGLSYRAIDAAWPSWWSDDLESSSSARAELRFTLARRLGLSPKPLLGERVIFVWRDNARFKHLTNLDSHAQDALTSFGAAIGQHLLRATPNSVQLDEVHAEALRAAILQTNPSVGLQAILAFCWGVGIPVVHLRVFPLQAKRMHAMVVHIDNRFAILLGKDAEYPAPVAFTLSHEIAHILLNHLANQTALVDLDDPAEADDSDDEESAADRFALELLTGHSNPDIQLNVETFNAAQLADVVLRSAPQYKIEPGVLALCVAYRTQAWPVAMRALDIIYSEKKPVWREVNGTAVCQLAWSELSDDAADYLRRVMGLVDV
jgi:Zn-dependent peptidase ImmA (M78 family)